MLRERLKSGASQAVSLVSSYLKHVIAVIVLMSVFYLVFYLVMSLIIPTQEGQGSGQDLSVKIPDSPEYEPEKRERAEKPRIEIEIPLTRAVR
jgi:hypothetical protein